MALLKSTYFNSGIDVLNWVRRGLIEWGGSRKTRAYGMRTRKIFLGLNNLTLRFETYIAQENNLQIYSF